MICCLWVFGSGCGGEGLGVSAVRGVGALGWGFGTRIWGLSLSSMAVFMFTCAPSLQPEPGILHRKRCSELGKVSCNPKSKP